MLTIQIVTLPYPLLLQKSAREALGLSVQGHVVVIDEGHNLMDAITGVYSITISLSQVQGATTHLTSYVQAFKNRLKGSNRVYIAQIIRLLRSVSDCLRERKTSSKSEGLLQPAQLLAGKNVDQLNPHSLIRYLHESKLLRKVEGFVEHQLRKAGVDRETSPKVSNELMLSESLMTVLVNPASEGRFFFSSQDHEVMLRYTLLDPANAFREVAEQARAIIVAGGTMSPVSETLLQDLGCADKRNRCLTTRTFCSLTYQRINSRLVASAMWFHRQTFLCSLSEEVLETHLFNSPTNAEKQRPM